jgi:hypothetical protein
VEPIPPSNFSRVCTCFSRKEAMPRIASEPRNGLVSQL